jgi:hypothetical protein
MKQNKNMTKHVTIISNNDGSFRCGDDHFSKIEGEKLIEHLINANIRHGHAITYHDAIYGVSNERFFARHDGEVVWKLEIVTEEVVAYNERQRASAESQAIAEQSKDDRRKALADEGVVEYTISSKVVLWETDIITVPLGDDSEEVAIAQAHQRINLTHKNKCDIDDWDITEN